MCKIDVSKRTIFALRLLNFLSAILIITFSIKSKDTIISSKYEVLQNMGRNWLTKPFTSMILQDDSECFFDNLLNNNEWPGTVEAAIAVN